MVGGIAALFAGRLGGFPAERLRLSEQPGFGHYSSALSIFFPHGGPVLKVMEAGFSIWPAEKPALFSSMRSNRSLHPVIGFVRENGTTA